MDLLVDGHRVGELQCVNNIGRVWLGAGPPPVDWYPAKINELTLVLAPRSDMAALNADETTKRHFHIPGIATFRASILATDDTTCDVSIEPNSVLTEPA